VAVSSAVQATPSSFCFTSISCYTSITTPSYLQKTSALTIWTVTDHLHPQVSSFEIEYLSQLSHHRTLFVICRRVLPSSYFLCCWANDVIDLHPIINLVLISPLHTNCSRTAIHRQNCLWPKLETSSYSEWVIASTSVGKRLINNFWDTAASLSALWTLLWYAIQNTQRQLNVAKRRISQGCLYYFPTIGAFLKLFNNR
jgi:hypothetical protein